MGFRKFLLATFLSTVTVVSHIQTISAFAQDSIKSDMLHLDIVGISLGMSAQDAVEVIKKHDKNLFVDYNLAYTSNGPGETGQVRNFYELILKERAEQNEIDGTDDKIKQTLSDNVIVGVSAYNLLPIDNNDFLGGIKPRPTQHSSQYDMSRCLKKQANLSYKESCESIFVETAVGGKELKTTGVVRAIQFGEKKPIAEEIEQTVIEKYGTDSSYKNDRANIFDRVLVWQFDKKGRLVSPKMYSSQCVDHYISYVDALTTWGENGGGGGIAKLDDSAKKGCGIQLVAYIKTESDGMNAGQDTAKIPVDFVIFALFDEGARYDEIISREQYLEAIKNSHEQQNVEKNKLSAKIKL